MYQVKKRSWGPAKPDPATGSALEWPRLFSYGGLAAFAQAEAPLGPGRMSERLLSVLSGPPGRMPGGDSATVPQHGGVNRARIDFAWVMGLDVLAKSTAALRFSPTGGPFLFCDLSSLLAQSVNTGHSSSSGSTSSSSSS